MPISLKNSPILSVFILIPALIAGAVSLRHTIPAAFEENHLVELAQAELLLGACLLFAMKAGRCPHAPDRILHAAFACFGYMVFLREVDIDRYGSHAFWTLLQAVLRLGAGAWGLWILKRCFEERRRFRAVFRLIWRNATTVLLFLTVLFYGAGVLFDRNLFFGSADLALFWEECLELNGAAVFFLSALTARSWFPLPELTRRGPAGMPAGKPISNLRRFGRSERPLSRKDKPNGATWHRADRRIRTVRGRSRLLRRRRDSGGTP